jgi:hypothetical protein
VDAVANRVQKFTRDGTRLSAWGSTGAGDGQFNGPTGITTDGSGNVYVADTGNQRVQAFTSDGTFITRFGSAGGAPGQFGSPIDVASDASGAVYVVDQANARVQEFAEPEPPPPPPDVGKTANVEPVSGTVLIRLPRATRFVRLTRAQQIPIGSVVDATHGVVKLTTASDARGTQQAARFYGGRFMIKQRRVAAPVTEIVLTGGRFDLCPKRARRGRRFRGAPAAIHVRAAAQRRKHAHKVVRRLWSDGKGNFRSKGHDASAGARGTIWLTEDRCDGTFVRVREGKVRVRDFALHQTIVVAAGHSYLAKRRP